MKRLILLGGGHAHVTVLEQFAQQRLAGWEVVLNTPHRRLVYSGMLPGWIAGHYPIDGCAIALDRLAASAGVVLHETAAVGLDLVGNTVRCADGSTQTFDMLSIDTGPVPALDHLPGSREHALPIRPIEGFVAAWPAVLERVRERQRRFDLCIIGAGAAGAELAFAVQHRAAVEGWSHLRVTLVGAGNLPLPGFPEKARRRTLAMLVQHGIDWLGERRATRVAPEGLHFEQGEFLPFDVCLAVTGAAAADWPRASGLATDAQGFIRVGPTLQSVSHPHVFAAGDAAAYAEPRPKSGVYAVKAGPVLAGNLRAICEGRVAQAWQPQRRALYLLSTGGRHALAVWGGWSTDGAWVWRWKDHIDRQFIRRFGAVAPANGDHERTHRP